MMNYNPKYGTAQYNSPKNIINITDKAFYVCVRDGDDDTNSTTPNVLSYFGVQSKRSGHDVSRRPDIRTRREGS